MPLAITPTFSPRTHTSDDSYIYQLSLVLATAIVSFVWKDNFAASRFHCHRYKRPVLNDIYSYLTPNHTRSALSNTVGKSVSLAFSWCYEYPPLLRLYEPAWSMYVCGSYLVQFVVEYDASQNTKNDWSQNIHYLLYDQKVDSGGLRMYQVVGIYYGHRIIRCP